MALCSFNHGLQVEPCCPGVVLPIRSQGTPIGDGLFGAAGIEGSDLARFKARAAACVQNLLSPCGEGHGGIAGTQGPGLSREDQGAIVPGEATFSRQNHGFRRLFLTHPDIINSNSNS